MCSVLIMMRYISPLDRTFPDHKLFTSGGPGRSSLLKVLAVYSQYNPTVGYCQGLFLLYCSTVSYTQKFSWYVIFTVFAVSKKLREIFDVKIYVCPTNFNSLYRCMF